MFQILKNHKEIVISNFPEKKWFGNLEESVIKERVIKLNGTNKIIFIIYLFFRILEATSSKLPEVRILRSAQLFGFRQYVLLFFLIFSY
jgi:hypothetical protein